MQNILEISKERLKIWKEMEMLNVSVRSPLFLVGVSRQDGYEPFAIFRVTFVIVGWLRGEGEHLKMNGSSGMLRGYLKKTLAVFVFAEVLSFVEKQKLTTKNTSTIFSLAQTKVVPQTFLLIYTLHESSQIQSISYLHPSALCNSICS